MVLKITRFLSDALNKQAKISHFNGDVKVGTPDKIRSVFRQMIQKQFGELFLNDANYIIMSSIQSDNEDFDKHSVKFRKLVETVLDTELEKNEVKTLNVVQPSDDAGSNDDQIDDDNDSAMSNIKSNVVLFIKVTTK